MIRALRTSLLHRVFAVNAAIFLLAGCALALTPVSVSAEIALREAAVLIPALVAILAVDLALLRRAMLPLRRLADHMQTVEPLRPGRRVAVDDGDGHIERVTSAFNTMVQRLEDERRLSVRRSLAAQEGERARVARELHDGIGQSLTALVLHMERLARRAPDDELRVELEEAREATRETLEEVRGLAVRLRPEALDDLGLPSAVVALCRRVADQSGLAVELDVDEDLGPLAPEGELVLYRVAQEALANTMRHACARNVLLRLGQAGDHVHLLVRDDGCGLGGSEAGGGMQGMRERALLADAWLHLGDAAEGGTEVRLRVPAAGAPRAPRRTPTA